jgi:hypothetical protein
MVRDPQDRQRGRLRSRRVEPPETINLAASTTVHKAIFRLPPISVPTATLAIKVLTSGKTIQVDGLGISRP